MITYAILISFKAVYIEIISGIVDFCICPHVIAYHAIFCCHITEVAVSWHTVLNISSGAVPIWFCPAIAVGSKFWISSLCSCDNSSKIQCPGGSRFISHTQHTAAYKRSRINFCAIPGCRFQIPVSCTPVVKHYLYILCGGSDGAFLFQMETLHLLFHKSRTAVIFIGKYHIQFCFLAKLLCCKVFIHINGNRILSLGRITHCK